MTFKEWAIEEGWLGDLWDKFKTTMSNPGNDVVNVARGLQKGIQTAKRWAVDDVKTTFSVLRTAYKMFIRDVGRAAKSLASKYEWDFSMKELLNDLVSTQAGQKIGKTYNLIRDLAKMFGQDLWKMVVIMVEAGFFPPIPGKIYAYVSWLAPHFGIKFASSGFGKIHNKLFPVWVFRAMKALNLTLPEYGQKNIESRRERKREIEGST